MKNLFKLTIFLVLVVLISANIFLFCSSLKLSGEISNFDKKTTSLHIENLSLEEQVSYLSSLQYAKDSASKLDFTKESIPTYLDKLNIALKY